MGLRRNTNNRFTIFRECATCGQHIVTTADTPWMRQVVVEENGKKRQLTKYYCSTECYQASYKHIGWYDGKAHIRRQEKDTRRDPAKRAATWKLYYGKNGDRIRERRRERYWNNHDEEIISGRWYRRKRKCLLESAGGTK